MRRRAGRPPSTAGHAGLSVLLAIATAGLSVSGWAMAATKQHTVHPRLPARITTTTSGYHAASQAIALSGRARVMSDLDDVRRVDEQIADPNMTGIVSSLRVQRAGEVLLACVHIARLSKTSAGSVDPTMNRFLLQECG